MREKEELFRESLSKLKQLNDLHIKYEKLLKDKISEEEKSRELVNINNDLKDLNKKLHSEVKTLQKEVNELKESEEGLKNTISYNQQKKLNFEAINSSLQIKHNELKDIYKETFEEKAKYEVLLSKFDEELEKSRKNEKDHYNKMNTIQNTLNELKMAMNSFMSFHKIEVQKLILLTQDDELSVFSSKLCDFLSEFKENLNQNYNYNDCLRIDSIKSLEDWSRFVSNELQVINIYNNIDIVLQYQKVR